MNKEEYEDQIMKFIGERKNLTYIIDPFSIEDSLSY